MLHDLVATHTMYMSRSALLCNLSGYFSGHALNLKDHDLIIRRLFSWQSLKLSGILT